MAAHAFAHMPAQAAEIQSGRSMLRNTGFFGVAEGWDMPLALWRARDGFDKTYSETPHCTLSFVLHGQVERMDGRFAGSRAARDHDGFMLSPGGTERRWAAPDDFGVCHLYFQRSLIDALARAESDGPAVELRGDRVLARDAFLRAECDRYLARACDHRDPASALEMDARAVVIGLRLLARHSNRVAFTARDPQALDRHRLTLVQEFVEANLEGDLRLDQLARAANITTRRLIEGFRAATGITPHRYVMERRIARAMSLLAQREKPLAEIALECGYASQQHFTTAFRASVGISPSGWRANMSGRLS